MRTMRTTNLFRDTDSILLRALVRYHRESKNQEIRRAMLLNLTGPEGDKMAPGTFQRSLNRLENHHILHCNKIGRNTIIVFNIEIVKNTLKKKEEALNLKFQNITEEIEPETWESMSDSAANKITEQITSSWGPSEVSEVRYGESVTKKAISGIVGLIMSRSLEVFILQESWNKVKSERKQAVEDLIRAAGRFTNGYPNERFTITIHFNGFQQTLDKTPNELSAPIIQKIAPYVLMYSEHVLNYRFSKQDKFFLSRSRIDDLSIPARKCFDIFINRVRTLIPKSAYNMN
jgi:hypothetical protein